MRKKIFKFAIVGGIIGICSYIPLLLFGWFESPQERTVEITPRKYAYDPPTFRVNKGDKVHIRFKTQDQDVLHGFYLEGYDIDGRIIPQSPYIEFRRPSNSQGEFERLSEIVFVADRVGKFRYRCSQTCGFMHPFMMGEMVVAPNRPYLMGTGMAVGLVLAMFVLFPSEKNENDKEI